MWNNNLILLKLKLRLDILDFYKDELIWNQKSLIVISRGMVYHKHRRDFVDFILIVNFADVGTDKKS